LYQQRDEEPSSLERRRRRKRKRGENRSNRQEAVLHLNGEKTLDTEAQIHLKVKSW